MVGTIKHCSFKIDERIAGNNTVLHLLFDTFLDRWNVIFWNHTTNNLTGKLQTFLTFISRREAYPAVTELTATTRLTDKLAFNLTVVTDRFTISNLRLTNICFNVKLTLHTVNQDIKV